MSTLRHRWHAWLGPAADDITDEQLAQLDAASDAIGTRWPDPDDTEDRERALSAAAQVILGDATLEATGQAWRASVRAEASARAALTGALIASHTGALRGPGSLSGLAVRSGASLNTVRKALGR